MQGKYTDYTGQQVGALKIIKRLISDKPKTVLWLAECQCGTTIEITTRRIKYLTVPSCGCQRPLHISRLHDNPQNLTINKYLKDYQYRANKHNIEWQLSDKDFKDLIQKSCVYCGQDPSHEINIYNRARFKKVQSQAAKERHKKAAINVSSIDRKCPDKGYTLDNCVASCMDCNYGKYTKTPQEFLEWIKRVYQHAISKNT